MRGVAYIAYGANALKEARLSIESLKMHNNLPVVMIGDTPDCHVNMTRRDKGGRWAKVNLDNLVPFDDVLYIDADTRIYGDLSAGFDVLDDGWDVVITPSTADWLWHVSDDERDATRLEAGRFIAQLQGGLFFFNKQRTKRFFELWREEWLRWKCQDQGALLRTLYKEPVRVWSFGKPWNGGTLVAHRFGAAR